MMGTNGCHHMGLGPAKDTVLVFLLLLSGTWQIDATYDAGGSVEALHPSAGDEFVDGRSPSESIEDAPSSTGDDGTSSLVRRQLLNSPTDRLGFCNESTVSHLTAAHFQTLENGFREFRCWTPRLGRLMTTLRQELTRGGNGPSFGGGGGRRQQSANEGSRLRCRILFKYDTCRGNFAKYRSMDNPEISVEWPEEIFHVINSTL